MGITNNLYHIIGFTDTQILYQVVWKTEKSILHFLFLAFTIECKIFIPIMSIIIIQCKYSLLKSISWNINSKSTDGTNY